MNAPELQPHVIADGLRFPEGPAFASDGALWCVELKGGALVRVDPVSHVLKRIDVGGAPNGLTIDAYDRIWFTDSAQNAIRRYDPEERKCVTIADQVDGAPLSKPNDLAFDRVGNLVFTCPGESRTEPTGYVCVLRPDGSVEMIANELYFPNGLVFLHDGQTLLIAETYKQRIWRGDWDDQSAVWTDESVWAPDLIGAPGPDGMAMGVDGRLYVAVYGSSQIKVVNPDGLIVEALDLTGKNPTNCAFDPDGALGLVITEAETGRLLSIPGAGTGMPLFDGGSAWPL